MLLEGRRLLITGVLTEGSIAFAVAKRAQEEGAEIVLTGFGRGLRITTRIAKRLGDPPPDVLEMDVNEPDQMAAVAADIEERWGALDGILHAIAFAPGDALGNNFLNTPVESAQIAFATSAYSLKSLTVAMLPLLEKGDSPSIVGLDFDAQVAWPVYDWMGVAKAALESVNRYLARDLGPKGIRSNLVSAGPISSMAAKSIPGFSELAGIWNTMAPLHWDTADAGPTADAIVFLLSNMSRGITGEIVHVDGGFHAMGAPPSPPAEPAADAEHRAGHQLAAARRGVCRGSSRLSGWSSVVGRRANSKVMLVALPRICVAIHSRGWATSGFEDFFDRLLIWRRVCQGHRARSPRRCSSWGRWGAVVGRCSRGQTSEKPRRADCDGQPDIRGLGLPHDR